MMLIFGTGKVTFFERERLFELVNLVEGMDLSDVLMFQILRNREEVGRVANEDGYRGLQAGGCCAAAEGV